MTLHAARRATLADFWSGFDSPSPIQTFYGALTDSELHAVSRVPSGK
jgi:hypothetical protein